MRKKIINPAALPDPRGFNHAIRTEGGRILWLAGQDGSDGSGTIRAPGDLVAQFEQVLLNLRTVVEAAGGSMQNIVKLNIYTTDRAAYLAQLKPLGVLMQAHFEGYYPAMAFFEVEGLFQPAALVEMEGVAVLDD